MIANKGNRNTTLTARRSTVSESPVCPRGVGSCKPRGQTHEQTCPPVSPGHVDVPVARSPCHLAEGDPDPHSDHQREGDHPTDHIGSASITRQQHIFTTAHKAAAPPSTHPQRCFYLPSLPSGDADLLFCCCRVSKSGLRPRPSATVTVTCVLAHTGVL